MATTKQDIEEWLKDGKKKKATHLLVVCDTFDWEDYPVYVTKEQDAHEVFAKYHGPNMQKVMEVYNLKKPLKPQLAAHRAMEF